MAAEIIWPPPLTAHPPNTQIEEGNILDEFLFPDPCEPLGTGMNGLTIKIYRRLDNKAFACKRATADHPTAKSEIDYWSYLNGLPQIARLEKIYRCTMRVAGDDPNDQNADRERFFIISDLLEGGNLFERIKNSAPGFTEAVASRYVRQMAAAVLELHKRNVTHRDLKPANFVFSSPHPDSEIRLVDFGFAKFDHEGSLSTPLMTWGFAAPEVVQRHRDIMQHVTRHQKYEFSRACDMWSLGVIIYILLCGYLPFNSKNGKFAKTPNMIACVMGSIYLFHRPQWDGISEAAMNVVRGLLVVDPLKRMTAEQLLADPWVTGKAAPLSPLPSRDLFQLDTHFNEASAGLPYELMHSDPPPPPPEVEPVLARQPAPVAIDDSVIRKSKDLLA
eukprot:m.165297 g.165297  ORF g.165297 m.165297 type:complete len:389 (-) comp15231_c4_seq14:174-1340(-)